MYKIIFPVKQYYEQTWNAFFVKILNNSDKLFQAFNERLNNIQLSVLPRRNLTFTFLSRNEISLITPRLFNYFSYFLPVCKSILLHWYPTIVTELLQTVVFEKVRHEYHEVWLCMVSTTYQ